MHNSIVGCIAAALIATPAQAADQTDARLGTFVGAQLKMSLGGASKAKPSARLAIAPTQSRFSGDGMIRTRIGEGIALDFASDTKPTLMLAGVRADTALGLRSQGQVNSDDKLGLTTMGWVGIGVGSVALLVGGLYLYGQHLQDCEDNDGDPCD